MGFLDNVKVWEDVLDASLDEKAAPSLGGVNLGREGRVYSDPVEFFRRTLITRHMVEALENVADALLGRGGNKLVMLLSLFGGGKTHTLLTIYHAFRNPAALLEAKAEDSETRERLHRLVEELSRLGGVRVVVLDGYFSELAPTPVNPLVVPGGYKVQTIWGSLAHQLGRFGEVRENDEKLLAPPADVLARLLGDEPVLILVDEIADYVAKLKSAGDEKLRDYGNEVLSFIEALAKAVDLTRRSVLIVSLPVEEKKGLKVEERYKPQHNVIVSLYKSIGRVASRRIVPVAPSDIPAILRVRIFESIDESAARGVSSSLARVYGEEDNREFFGEDAIKKAHLVERTYPFHPSYIDTLVDIVDKHEGLEKTRDAIRITRKVVRKLIEAGSSAELIMPFHIDVEDREIRSILLSHELYRQYTTILQEDIIERTKGYEKQPELAKIVAKTVFVKTFVYAGSVKDYHVYPDTREVVVSSFEPAMARELGLQPKDYVDALEWASTNLVFLVSEEGRYWFTQLASPVRMVEMRAKTVDDYDALKIVEEYAWKLLTKPYEYLVSGSRKYQKGVVRSPFNVSASLVVTEPEPVDHDARDYILVAILSPVSKDDIERVLYELPSGGSRSYANTVYLIYPRNSDSVSQMLGFAKHLVACNSVGEELDLLYRDDEIREVMRKKLEKYCKGMDGVEGKLVVNILAGLNLVAYPSFDESTHRNTFKLTQAAMSDTIIETATRALKTTKPPKLYEELDFDMLDHILSQIGINLSEGDRARTVSNIIDYFYSNPRLPMVKEEVVRDALIEGVKDLKIGVKSANKIFFKKVYECSSRRDCNPPSLDEGEAPHVLKDDDLILPWRIALREQLESLKEVREERVPGGIRRTWHAVYVEGDLVPVAEALESLDLASLRHTPIVRITEVLEEGVDIKLEEHEVTASPGEEVTIKVLVEKIGDFEGELAVEASEGELSPDTLTLSEGTPSAIIEWRVKVPEEPGTYVYEVKAVDASSRETLKAASLRVIVRPRMREASKGVPSKGTKLSAVEIKVPEFNFKPLKILLKKFGASVEVEDAMLELEAEVGDRKPRVMLRLNNVSLEDLISMFPMIAQKYGSVSRLTYTIRLKPRDSEYILAPEFTENEAEDIKDYIVYYVYESG